MNSNWSTLIDRERKSTKMMMMMIFCSTAVSSRFIKMQANEQYHRRHRQQHHPRIKIKCSQRRFSVPSHSIAMFCALCVGNFFVDSIQKTEPRRKPKRRKRLDKTSADMVRQAEQWLTWAQNSLFRSFHVFFCSSWSSTKAKKKEQRKELKCTFCLFRAPAITRTKVCKYFRYLRLFATQTQPRTDYDIGQVRSALRKCIDAHALRNSFDVRQ